jgi:hypothetical protein
MICNVWLLFAVASVIIIKHQRTWGFFKALERFRNLGRILKGYKDQERLEVF